MILKAKKAQLNGVVNIPASKSHTIRAVAIAALADGVSCVRNPLISNDALSAAETYKALGAQVDRTDKNCWKIKGNAGKITLPDKIIDVGNSGTTLRLALGSAGLAEKEKKVIFTGDKQIQKRPIAPLLKALNDLGAKAKAVKNNDAAPVEISGKLAGGKTTVECFTSQYLSSLLLACPLAENDSEITVPLLNEPDYVKITLDWLDWQNIKYQNDRLKHIVVKGGQKYKPFDKQIPADFSSATFFICAAAICENADITIKGLDFSDSQPDKAVVDYLKQMNADITVNDDGLRIKTSRLKGTNIDMNRTPDALCAMAVAAAVAEGTTKLSNVPQARKKETDRIACMAKELAKMGAKIEELPDGLLISGGKLKAAELNGYDDHRIVMALAIAAMTSKQTSCINTAEAMNVTFPDFVCLMNKLGAGLEICS